MARTKARTGVGLEAALDAVFSETVALFHRLRAVAEQIHGHGEMSAGRRGVLRSLDRMGPQTVPQLARSRPVSRQHMQSHVDALLGERLVELLDNPAHERSHLVRLTALGKALLDTMSAREARWLRELRLGIPAERLQGAAEVLRDVRSHLESPEWNRRLQKPKSF